MTELAAPAAPLRVGVDAACWWNDRGYGRFTRELVTALAARPDSGFHYTLFADRAAPGALPDAVSVVTVEAGRTLGEATSGRGARSPRELFAFGRAVAHCELDLFFFPAVYSWFPLQRRLPSVVAIHDTIPERFPELLFPTRVNRWLWRAKVAWARRQARRFMTVSETSARDLEQLLGIPRQRIDVVTEAADAVFRPLEDPGAVAAARARLGVAAEAPLLVYVGGLNRHKNVMGLLRALPPLLDRFPTLAVAIVGDTSGRGFYDNAPELQAHVAADARLAACVRFPGYLPDAEVAALLNGATACILPSLWEGFGLPALEAMACGTPVLASDRGSLPEVVGEAGRFFDPEDPASIGAAVTALVGDPAERARRAAIALQRAKEFRWERAAELAEASFRRTHLSAEAD